MRVCVYAGRTRLRTLEAIRRGSVTAWALPADRAHAVCPELAERLRPSVLMANIVEPALTRP